MKINIEAPFRFSVTSVTVADGEIKVTLSASGMDGDTTYGHRMDLGSAEAEARPSVSLLQYAAGCAARSGIKPKTRDSYRHMSLHLERYGDRAIDAVTTEYLQGFLSYLEAAGLKPNTVRMYFQKLACVLHEAYRNGLFDDRVLQRVRRPARPKSAHVHLTASELARMARQPLPGKYSNVRDMFLFSCHTGLRFSDVQGLRWSDVKRRGGHLFLEFHQRKTDTDERLPLCSAAEEILQSREHTGGMVFGRESNQQANSVLQRWHEAARIRKHVTFHCGRHTFCVQLLTEGVPLYTVQRLMCHSDIGTTEIYADLQDKAMRKAVGKMPHTAIPQMGKAV